MELQHINGTAILIILQLAVPQFQERQIPHIFPLAILLVLDIIIVL